MSAAPVTAARRGGPVRAMALAVAAAALAVAARPALAENAAQVRRALDSLAVDERLGAAVPRDAVFVDEAGKRVSLRDLGGQPVLLSFNYVACLRLCGVQLAGIARALHEDGWKGEGFSLLTVSIDPDEAQGAAVRTKEDVVREVGGGAAVAGAWRFVRGNPGDVEDLAHAVGVKFRRDPSSGQIAHPATLVVLTGDGRVSAYVHGIRPAPEALRAAVERARADRVATAAEQASVGGFLLTCVGLDPNDPAPLALRVMRAIGTFAALFLVGFIGLHALRGARARREQSP